MIKTNKQHSTPRRKLLKRHKQGATAAFYGKQILQRAGRPGKPANGNFKLLEGTESVLAASQFVFDLAGETSISAFINDDGREIGRCGRRFDFRTICNPACQAMERQVATGQPWPKTVSLLTSKGRWDLPIHTSLMQGVSFKSWALAFGFGDLMEVIVQTKGTACLENHMFRLCVATSCQEKGEDNKKKHSIG